jgi:biotin transporter BioY
MSTRDLVLSALFAAIIVALGILPPITLGFIPVPITAQSLGVMMAGVVLGARRGTVAVLIVLVLSRSACRFFPADAAGWRRLRRPPPASLSAGSSPRLRPAISASGW